MPPRKLEGYVVMDLETTIKSYKGRKASPFTDENWVVAAAFKASGRGQTTDVLGSYWGEDKRGSEGWLKALLEGYWPRVMAGFNIKFDILHAIKYEVDRKAYMQWVAAGGLIWDTQLEEYLLDGMVQESHMLSLDEVAPKYGGQTKIDEVKAMWEQGIDTHLIPRQLLMDYLTGRVEDGVRSGGDILNTELIFLGQLAASRSTGQLKSAQLNMGALSSSTEMEFNGLHVNEALGRTQAEKLRERVASLTQSLTTFLPSDLPFEFKWSSRTQLSALIFGGSVRYKQRVHQTGPEGEKLYSSRKEEHVLFANGTSMSVEAFEKATEDGATMLMPERYSGGKKVGMFKTKQVSVPDLDKPKLKWEDFYYEFPAMTTPKREWEGSTKGVYSVAAAVIEELGDSGIPFLEELAKLASIQKDLGTYYITEEFGEDGEVVKAKGMLTLIGFDGIVHHQINHTSTVTGRLSANNPNTQNLPKESTSEVKMLFDSRFGSDGVMVSSDFSSLEVYCQANLTGDAQLISDLWNGLDMHSARLATAEGMEYEDVLLLTKGDKKRGIKPVHEWEVKRTDIKVFSFQRAYGAGAPKISRHLKKPQELVEQWIEADEKRYPGIVAFNEKLEAVVKASRVPIPKFVYHPDAKTNVQLGRGHMRTWDGKLYRWTEQISPKWLWERHHKLAGFSPTELKNYPMQGMGGEWMKAAMWIAVRAFYYYDNFGGKAFLVNTVHDALYVDAHKSVARKAAVLMEASMLAASDFMEYQFDHKVNVPVPTETSYGPSMFEENSFEDHVAFDAAVQKTRTWLRSQFMDNYSPSYL